MTPHKPKVHKKLKIPKYTDRFGFVANLCSSPPEIYSEGANADEEVDCLRCLKLMNKQTQGKRG